MQKCVYYVEPVTSVQGGVRSHLTITHGFVCCQDGTGTLPSTGGGCGTLCIEHTTAFFGGGTVLVLLLHKPGEHMVRRMECGA